MACETMRQPNQTLEERKKEVREVVEELARDLAAGRVKARVGEEGGIVFDGMKNRKGVTDACAYRRLMVSGGALAKAAIAKAETLAGRTVNRQAIANGLHSHDGGKTWHHGH